MSPKQYAIPNHGQIPLGANVQMPPPCTYGKEVLWCFRMHTEELDAFAVQVACALYEAAVAKYEAVLEMDPRNRTILRNCAFAMYDLGRLQPDPASRTACQLLEVRFLGAPAAIPSGRARQCFAAISWRGMKGMCRCSAQRMITTCGLQDTEKLYQLSFQVLRLPCF